MDTLSKDQTLQAKITQYWHISRTAMACRMVGNNIISRAPTRIERIDYVVDALQKNDTQLLEGMTSKQLWHLVSDETSPFLPVRHQ